MVKEDAVAKRLISSLPLIDQPSANFAVMGRRALLFSTKIERVSHHRYYSAVGAY
jgi:hypothetical protein